MCRIRCNSLMIFAALLFNAQAIAATVTFTDRATWEAAAGSFATEDFEGVTPIEADTAGETLSLADFDIVVDENHGEIAIRSFGEGSVIGGTQSFFGDVHVTPCTSGPAGPCFQDLVFGDSLRAFGADFAAGDAEGVTLNLLLGMTEVYPISFSGISFFGVITTEAFTTISITGGSTGSGFYVMDNVGFSAIPVPAAAWLFGSALGLLGWMRIRGRNITPM